ncbi:MAG: galactose mutarotase [Hamadaea sp.]|uniref:aldose epimerase family protein n=1 Tax=Hamadaea sp. TaxID=2024425 RepID=UPI0017EFF461|nr:aldose epimerase family protein [Hamadaea sp.]NUT18753.1 galactose mutarotase [Hamadaea sp.]
MSTATRHPFGTTPEGTEVGRWRLDNGHGVTADILTFGATLHGFAVDGAPLVLALQDIDAYAGRHPYLGAVVGRYANRIARGRFELDGQAYAVAANEGDTTLHGGPDGFDRRIWTDEALDGAVVRLTLTSPDGDQGFPGTLTASVTYSLDEHGVLALDYEARTDRPTVVNLTNHAYFNLAGSDSVLGHELVVDSEAYLAIDEAAIPFGPSTPVAGTPFDLRVPQLIGDALKADDPQLAVAGGFDHCWLLPATGRPRRAARLADPVSGRWLEVWTTEPGIQVYTGNRLDGELFPQYAGICLETQRLPNSPNEPAYPSATLRPGEDYRSRTELRVG